MAKPVSWRTMRPYRPMLLVYLGALASACSGSGSSFSTLVPSEAAPAAGGSGNMPGTSNGGGTSGGEAGSPNVPVVMSTPDPTPSEPPPPPESDITFSVPSGTFEGSLSVSMQTKLPGAVIRYTTDGSAPDAESPIYSGDPIELSETRQIRAQAFEDGVTVGAGATGLYIARTFDMTSDLPLII